MKKINILIVSFVFLFSAWAYRLSAQNQSRIVHPDHIGRLVYTPYNNKGDILPDFSFCGYMGGGVALPDVPVKIVLEPGDFSKDDAPRIQEAINTLSKKQADEKGIRGAILLKRGKYNIRQTIELNSSGIVLRGEGDGEDGTLLIGTKAEVYTLIRFGSGGKPEQSRSQKRKIIDTYIPSGSKQLNVDKVEGYSVGDRIIVHRVSTREWIEAIGMDKIADNWVLTSKLSPEVRKKMEREGRMSPDGKQCNVTIQWEPGSKDLSFLRTITAIEGNTITLDIPLTNAFQKEYGGGYIYRYSYQNWVSQSGIEQLRAVSEFNPNIMNVEQVTNKDQQAKIF